MAYNVKRFSEEVERIASTNPTYRTGGTGKDGTCDCIGLIMGAMYALGSKKYPMHSTNYFSRYEMTYLTTISGAVKLQMGDLVYKRREDNGKLNARYKSGGRYYTGDLYDYYHVGVVTSEEPLRITHCTERDGKSGIVVDTKIGDWGFVGQLKGLAYDEKPDEDEEPFGIVPSETGEELENGIDGDNVASHVRYAVVTSPDGNQVKLRKSASTREPVYWMIATGTRVQVERERSGWSLIRGMCTDGHIRRAYMMSKFLEME